MYLSIHGPLNFILPNYHDYNVVKMYVNSLDVREEVEYSFYLILTVACNNIVCVCVLYVFTILKSFESCLCVYVRVRARVRMHVLCVCVSAQCKNV